MRSGSVIGAVGLVDSSSVAAGGLSALVAVSGMWLPHQVKSSLWAGQTLGCCPS